jgi:hypothetical protein
MSLPGIKIEGGITIGGGVSIGPNPVNPSIISNGLQLYLDASNAASYSGSGTTWYDMTANHNDVAMQNSGDITYTSSGGGYFSTGATGYFNKTSATNVPTGSTPYTVSAWVQFPTGWPGGSNNHTIAQIGSAPTYYNLNSFVATSDGYLGVGWFLLNTDPPNLISNSWTPSSPGTAWMNVVSQWNGSTRNIWYNGVLQATDSIGTYLANNTDILIGLDFPGFGNYLVGNIGQVLIYNRALSQAELLQNFNSVRSRYGI